MSTHPAPPGVDDPGVGEGLELVGGARERLLGGVDGGLAHVGERATGLGGLDRGGGTGIRDREDRALLRVGHAGARRGRPAGEGVGEEERVDDLGVALDDGVAQAADELADDDAAVAPRREQDGPPAASGTPAPGWPRRGCRRPRAPRRPRRWRRRR